MKGLRFIPLWKCFCWDEQLVGILKTVLAVVIKGATFDFQSIFSSRPGKYYAADEATVSALNQSCGPMKNKTERQIDMINPAEEFTTSTINV